MEFLILCSDLLLLLIILMFIIIFMNPAEFSSRHELIVNENLLNDASRNLDITNRLYRQ